MSDRICVDCGTDLTDRPMWNGGRCLDCHEDHVAHPYGQGEDYAGERYWED